MISNQMYIISYKYMLFVLRMCFVLLAWSVYQHRSQPYPWPVARRSGPRTFKHRFVNIIDQSNKNKNMQKTFHRTISWTASSKYGVKRFQTKIMNLMKHNEALNHIRLVRTAVAPATTMIWLLEWRTWRKWLGSWRIGLRRWRMRRTISYRDFT